MTVLQTHRHRPQLESLHHSKGADLSHTSSSAYKETCLLPMWGSAVTCEPEISLIGGTWQSAVAGMDWTPYPWQKDPVSACHTRLVSPEATGSIVVAVSGQSNDHLAIGRAEGRVECLPRLPLVALRRVGAL